MHMAASPNISERLQQLSVSREAARQRRQKETQAKVEALHTVRKEAEEVSLRLLEKANDLRDFVRRNATDEDAATMLTFANAHVRVAGAMGQGIRRAVPMDRLLQRATREREEAERLEAARQAAEEQRREDRAIEKTLSLTEDAFDAVYGELFEENDDA